MVRKTLIALVAVAGLACLGIVTPTASQLQAQDDPSASTPVISVIALRYAEAKEVESLIGRLRGPSPLSQIVADQKTNSLLVRAASQDELDRIREMVSIIDVQTGSPAGDVVTQIVKLQFRTVEEILPVVEMYIGPGGKFAVNERTNTIVIKDNRARVDQIVGVVGDLDLDPVAVQLDCWILSPNRGAGLTGELAPLAEELQRLKLGRYGLFSHSSIRSLEGHPFTLSQSFKKRQMRSMELSGRIRFGRPSNQAILELDSSIQIGLTAPSADQAAEADTRLTLSTTVKAAIDDFVVLGLAPTGSESSKPLVLVVRVRR